MLEHMRGDVLKSGAVNVVHRGVPEGIHEVQFSALPAFLMDPEGLIRESPRDMKAAHLEFAELSSLAYELSQDAESRRMVCLSLVCFVFPGREEGRTKHGAAAQDATNKNTVHAILALDKESNSLIISFRGTQLDTQNLIKSLQAVCVFYLVVAAAVPVFVVLRVFFFFFACSSAC